MWISKIQKLQLCKFNKNLFLKFFLNSEIVCRRFFFEKMHLELDKSLNVIMKEFMFSEAATGGFYKKGCS